jgi:hypothetical protein
VVAWQEKPRNIDLLHDGESFAEQQISHFVVFEHISSNQNRIDRAINAELTNPPDNFNAALTKKGQLIRRSP